MYRPMAVAAATVTAAETALPTGDPVWLTIWANSATSAIPAARNPSSRERREQTVYNAIRSVGALTTRSPSTPSAATTAAFTASTPIGQRRAAEQGERAGNAEHDLTQALRQSAIAERLGCHDDERQPHCEADVDQALGQDNPRRAREIASHQNEGYASSRTVRRAPAASSTAVQATSTITAAPAVIANPSGSVPKGWRRSSPARGTSWRSTPS